MTETTQTQNIHEQAFKAGFKNIIPITPPDCQLSAGTRISPNARGKAPGIKVSDQEWAGLDFTQDLHVDIDRAKRWDRWSAGLGLKTGYDMVALDADIEDEDLARKLYLFLKKHGFTGPLRFGKKPKFLIPFLVMKPTNSWDLYFENRHGERYGIQLLGIGKQFVAKGVHPGTKKPYIWTDDIFAEDGLDKVELLDEAKLETLRELVKIFCADNNLTITKASAGTGTRASVPPIYLLAPKPKQVVDLMGVLPNPASVFPDQPAFAEMAYALRGALGAQTADTPGEPLARQLFTDWALKWDGGANAPEEIDKAFDGSEGAVNIGWDFLLEKSRECGVNSAALEFRDQPVPAGYVEPPRTTAHKFAADSLGNTLVFDEKHLLRDLLPETGVAMMYGASGVGKSFLALDMGLRIAHALPWQGRRTDRTGLVYYLASESGEGDMLKRLKAWVANVNGGQINRRFAYDLGQLDIGAGHDSKTQVADLIDNVREAEKELGEPCVMVVIDTLARNMAGDENSTSEMGAFIKGIDRLRDELNALVMLVHHTGKDEHRGARGSSALKAAVDVEIEIKRDKLSGLNPNEGSLRVTKSRTGSDGNLFGFRLEDIPLGDRQITDASGYTETVPVSSLVVKEIAAPVTPVTQPKGRHQVSVVEKLKQLDPDGVGVKMDDLIDELVHDEPRGTRNTRQHKKRAIEELASKNPPPLTIKGSMVYYEDVD